MIPEFLITMGLSLFSITACKNEKKSSNGLTTNTSSQREYTPEEDKEIRLLLSSVRAVDAELVDDQEGLNLNNPIASAAENLNQALKTGVEKQKLVMDQTKSLAEFAAIKHQLKTITGEFEGALKKDSGLDATLRKNSESDLKSINSKFNTSTQLKNYEFKQALVAGNGKQVVYHFVRKSPKEGDLKEVFLYKAPDKVNPTQTKTYALMPPDLLKGDSVIGFSATGGSPSLIFKTQNAKQMSDAALLDVLNRYGHEKYAALLFEQSRREINLWSQFLEPATGADFALTKYLNDAILRSSMAQDGKVIYESVDLSKEDLTPFLQDLDPRVSNLIETFALNHQANPVSKAIIDSFQKLRPISKTDDVLAKGTRSGGTFVDYSGFVNDAGTWSQRLKTLAPSIPSIKLGELRGQVNQTLTDSTLSRRIDWYREADDQIKTVYFQELKTRVLDDSTWKEKLTSQADRKALAKYLEENGSPSYADQLAYYVHLLNVDAIRPGRVANGSSDNSVSGIKLLQRSLDKGVYGPDLVGLQKNLVDILESIKRTEPFLEGGETVGKVAADAPIPKPVFLGEGLDMATRGMKVPSDWAPDVSRMMFDTATATVYMRVVQVDNSIGSKGLVMHDIIYENKKFAADAIEQIPPADRAGLSFYASFVDPSTPKYIVAVAPSGKVYQLAGKNTEFIWADVLNASKFEMIERGTIKDLGGGLNIHLNK